MIRCVCKVKTIIEIHSLIILSLQKTNIYIEDIAAEIYADIVHMEPIQKLSYDFRQKVSIIH